MKAPRSDDNPWRAIGLTSAIGADLVACMGAGYWIGDAISQSTGQRIWIVIGIMLGFVVGVVSVIFLLRKFTGGSNE